MTLPHNNLAWLTLGAMLTTLAITSMPRPTHTQPGKIYAVAGGHRFTINAAGARVWLDTRPPDRIDLDGRTPSR
jgi:drug/metabolite transporter superfamily protein YnfA